MPLTVKWTANIQYVASIALASVIKTESTKFCLAHLNSSYILMGTHTYGATCTLQTKATSRNQPSIMPDI